MSLVKIPLALKVRLAHPSQELFLRWALRSTRCFYPVSASERRKLTRKADIMA